MQPEHALTVDRLTKSYGDLTVCLYDHVPEWREMVKRADLEKRLNTIDMVIFAILMPVVVLAVVGLIFGDGSATLDFRCNGLIAGEKVGGIDRRCIGKGYHE